MIVFYIPKFRQGGLEAIFSRYFGKLLINNKVLLITDYRSLDYLDKKLVNHEHFQVELISGTRVKKIIDICRILQHYRFKNIHCVQYDAARLMVLLTNFFHTNIIYHERSYVNNVKLNMLKILNYCSRKPIKVITANSLDQVNLLARKFNTCQNIRLHNPIISEPVRNDITYTLQQKPRPRFFSVGRFDNQKNIEFLIKNIDMVIHVFGSNIQLDIFLNKESYLRAKDFLPHPAINYCNFEADLSKKLHKYDMGIIPTKFEGFSNIIFEAGFAGVPLVINQHDHGLREMEDLFLMEIFNCDDLHTFENALEKVKSYIHSRKTYKLKADSLNMFCYARSLAEFSDVAEKLKA